MAFAGLWETWHDIDTFTIVTTTAIDSMGQVHERMPLILSPERSTAGLILRTTTRWTFSAPSPTWSSSSRR